MSGHKTKAKELLRHYFTLACKSDGRELNDDCYAEIDEIVDAIIEAAVTKSARRVADLERVSAGAQDDQAMSGVATCRVCGCTDDEACEGGCYWVEDPEGLGDLCSKCLIELHKKFEAAIHSQCRSCVKFSRSSGNAEACDGLTCPLWPYRPRAKRGEVRP